MGACGQITVSLDSFSRIVRLGEGLSRTGRLDTAAMDRAYDALAICAERLARRQIPAERLSAVATQACRAAENGPEFVARVAAGTGLKLRVIVRLLPPLLFAMFVIVPPQSYYELVEALGRLAPQADAYHNAFTADFWVRYATASGNWCDADDCLVTPTWNHMWFVAYLLLYSLLLAGLLALTFGRLRGLGDLLERGLKGWGLLIWPIVFLAIIRWGLVLRFEITHDLVNDWYNHALSFSAFLFGFLTARSGALREGFIRLRWPALILGLVAWAAWAGYAWEYRAEDAMPAEALRRLMRGVYAADQWAFIVAILGFGARHLNRGGPMLHYLTIGVFPFYIVHQTVIVC